MQEPAIEHHVAREEGIAEQAPCERHLRSVREPRARARGGHAGLAETRAERRCVAGKRVGRSAAPRFEDRVARALSKLGVYTQNDVQRLAARVDELAAAVNNLVKGSAGGPVVKPARPAAKRKAPAPVTPKAAKARKRGPKK